MKDQTKMLASVFLVLMLVDVISSKYCVPLQEGFGVGKRAFASFRTRPPQGIYSETKSTILLLLNLDPHQEKAFLRAIKNFSTVKKGLRVSSVNLQDQTFSENSDKKW